MAAKENLTEYINLSQENVEEAFNENQTNTEMTETNKAEEKAEEEEKYAIKKEAEAEEKKEADTILIHRILDRDQTVPKKVHNKDPNHTLNSVDKAWKYNMTLGDLELRTITHYDGTQETLWFPMEQYPKDYHLSADNDQKKKKKKETPPRKVFVALKVKRVSAVDNIAETFRMRFHMYFNWLPSESDYKSYYRAQKEAKSRNDPTLLIEWEPRWYPHLEFQNMIEEHTREWEEYPEEGRFRIQSFKDFGQDKKDVFSSDAQFDCKKAKFLRAKLECEMTFAEELELQSFPFDCQDLSCIIHERTTGGVRCVFLPEFRKPNFGSIDPRYSVIDEWDLETAIIEFGDADPAASRSKSSYAMIVLRLKVKRRWKVFFANIVFLMACISVLALTAFSLSADDLGDRLNLLITLILTAVAFSYVVFDSLPNVPYLTFMDKYILGSYAFLVSLMIETAMLRQSWFSEEADTVIFYVCIAWLFAYNCAFACYGWYLRRDESEKLQFNSDQIEREVNLSRPGLRFDYTKRMRSGIDGRLLSFVGYTVASHHMDDKQKAVLMKKQGEMDKLYQQQTTRHGYDASEIPESPLVVAQNK